MRFGLTIDPTRPVAEVIAEARRIADAGFTSVSCAQFFAHDALTLLALVGTQVPQVELVTAVVPTYPRHPLALASQALTVQAATGGRLTLGIGVSHQVVIEGMFGYSYEKPARHMREYLRVLQAAMRREPVAFAGETLRAATYGPIQVEAPPPRVLLAALAPTMLRIAGRLADGTVTWMTGPATIASHVAPTITAAARDAGRPAPKIAVGLPVCVTADAGGARRRAAELFGIYGTLPNYQRMLEREGVDGPAGVAIVGDEEAVATQIGRVADAGATDFAGSLFGSREERERTFALLAALARR